MYSKSDLKADLTAMGLKGSETVIIHSSLKSIGEVENRADGILDALVEFFKDGLLVFPSMSYNLVNAKQPVFSVRDTPCCVSMLPELFRRRPGVIRSLHPTHAVAAIPPMRWLPSARMRQSSFPGTKNLTLQPIRNPPGENFTSATQ